MNVKELHIGVRLELDKINSGLYDYITDKEIDYYLNKEQIKFIKDRYNPASNQYNKGLEQDEKRTIDLKNLHVTYYRDNVYTTEEDNKFRFKLPEDFMLLTSQRAGVYYNYCKTITTQTITETKRYVEIPFAPNLLTAENFSYFRLFADVVSNPLISAIEGYFFPEDTLNFIAKLKEVIKTGYTVYYQGFYNIYKSNTLFIEIPSSARDIYVSYNAETYTSYRYKELTLTRKEGLTNGSRELNPLRRVQIDDLYVMLKDSFSKPNPEYPLAIEHTNFIDSYSDETFIIEYLAISYIRSPKPISLSLNISSELDDNIHTELIAGTVNTILEAIESRRYESNQLELKRIE